MNTACNITELRHDLAVIENYVARLTAQLAQAEGMRDRLISELADNIGAHDQRPIGLR